MQRRLELQHASAPKKDAAKTTVAPVAKRGFLKVVVSPWARVLVDGRHYDDTPFAAPIALPAGEHRIGLRNTYYQSVDRIVIIEPGKTMTLKLALVPRKDDER